MKGISFYGNDFFTIKTDKDLYAEELRRLLMTRPGERVGQPFFGIGLGDYLFELGDTTTFDSIRGRIEEQAAIYLPKLVITKFETANEDNSLFISLGFMEKGDAIQDERILTLEFGAEE